MEKKIFNELKNAFEAKENGKVIMFCEKLALYIRCRETVNKINEDYVEKKEK